MLGVADVVVEARDVEGNEHPAARSPAHVLAVLVLLAHQVEYRLAVAEVRAPLREAAERVAAIRPLVVARQEDERMANPRELRFSFG